MMLQREKWSFVNSTETSQRRFYHHAQLMYLAIVSTLTLAVCAILFIMRSRKRGNQSYDAIDESATKMTLAPVDQNRRRSSAKPFPGICVYQNQPIDFILPGLATHVQTLGSGQEVITLSHSESHESLTQGKGQTDESNSTSGVSSVTSLLGGLNPELYRTCTPEYGDLEEDYPENHRGRIWFKLQYQPSNEQLSVSLVKIKNLPSRVRGSINCCDPFVRIYLLPDGRRYVQSKVKKKTCNPRFDETFVFQAPRQSIHENALRLTVVDNDRGKRHNVIGHVVVKLKDIELNSPEPLLLSRDLEANHDEPPSESGEINVSLYYNPSTERLTVTVFEAKNLRWLDEGTPTDTYVKVSLFNGQKLVKVKKTAVAKKGPQPSFNESFHFKTSQSAVGTSHILLQVNLAHVNNDKTLGWIALGSHMFARGKALEHWVAATATNPQKQTRQWHKLSE